MNRDYFTADQFLRSNRICRPTREPRALLPDPEQTLVASNRMAQIDVTGHYVCGRERRGWAASGRYRRQPERRHCGISAEP